jgi:hypothetical protein
MCSRIETLRRRAARAALGFAVLRCAAGCGASGDQVLGDILPDLPPGADSGSQPDAPPACANFMTWPAHEIGFDLDIYFLIDRSNSMVDPLGDKWDLFVSGFTRFLHSNTANGVAIGVGYFPARQRGSMCDPNTYERADVDIGPMPENAGAIAMSLGPYPLGPPFGPTVMRPALHGALDYATSRAAYHRDERVYVVLLAGGPPTPECPSDTIDDVASAAAASNTKTVVVTFDYDNNAPSLEPIATRGGGGLFSFDAKSEDVEPRFVSLVDQLRAERHCDYDLPQGAVTDRVKLEITLPSDGGSATTFSYPVKNRDDCSDSLGWYYDRADRPTRIVACPKACEKIQGPPEATVSITWPTCSMPFP